MAKLTRYGLDGKVIQPLEGKNLNNAEMLGSALNKAKGLNGRAAFAAMGDEIKRYITPFMPSKAQAMFNKSVISEPQAAFHARQRKLGVEP